MITMNDDDLGALVRAADPLRDATPDLPDVRDEVRAAMAPPLLEQAMRRELRRLGHVPSGFKGPLINHDTMTMPDGSAMS